MAIRPERLGARAALLLLGTIVALQAVMTLQNGEPDYRDHYNQPLSAHVALLIGAALAVVALVPWRESPRDRQREPLPRRGATPQTAEKRPGRNDPCPCGSGQKYKRCCLAADEERRRAESIRGRSAALNRANEVTSVTAVANRGLSGW